MKTSCTSLHKLLVAALMLLPLAGQAQEISASALEQIGALIAEKESRSPAEQKMDSQLVYLAAQAQGQPAANGVPSLQVDVQQDADDRVLVDISGTVSESLTTAITEAGGEVVNQFAPFNAIRAKVPVSILETLAARADVLSVGPAAQAITNMGSALSQADRTHKANTARGNLGVTGNGVKIGVLSDGVNSLSASKNNGNLNASATVLPGQAGSGDEGTAMMELIQDLAPGAQIIFATAFNGNASFASNIIALQAAGCSIIVDDVSYFNESPFQDQVIAQAVSTVSAAGVLYFSSAGNSGNKNDGTSGAWEGDFVSGGVVAAPVTGTGNILDFGGSTFNTVAAGGSSRRVDLFWSDPDLASANDYDLFVLDSTGASVLRSSTNLQTGTQSPYESTGTLNVGERIVIVQRAGAANRFIQLTTGRARLTISTSGVVRGHNASGAANAFCVAATDVANSPSPNVFVGGVTNPVETFSSDGPRRIFFDPAGTALTPGNFSSTGGQVLNKPDITAADGAATSVAGFTTFFGTSAAAPHAAAIAALLKSYKPSLTPAQIRTAMTSTALDIEAAGNDRDSGVGIVMAEPALVSVGAPDPLVVTTSGDLNASGLVGGPFTPTSVTYTLTNTSGSPVNWTASKTQAWTTLTPTSGTLASAANVVLTCTIDAVAAAALVAGSYADAVTITNTTSGFSRNLAVNLVVTSAALPVVLAYDNVTTFSGQVSSHGGATTTATGTTVFADDVTCVVGSAGMNVTSFQFTVSNLDVASFSARPRVRFWVADGAGGGPGTVINGFSFNPITFPANGVQTFTATLTAGQLIIPAGEKIWAGMLFDGASGSTATVANLNNLGQGIFNPPAVGSSADTFWRSTSPGSNLVSNPAGSFSNFAGAPVANFGWKFQGASLSTVTTAAQSAVTTTTATLGGTVTTDGGSTVTERGIVWGLALNPTTANTKVANGSGTGAFSATVTGLPAGTTVHVRAYAINGIGTAYGSDISFTTLAPAPTVTLTSTAVNANATTLTITGTNFDAATPGNNTVVFTPVGTGTVTAATVTTLTVTSVSGLRAGTLSAVVTNGAGNSGAAVQVATVAPVITSDTANLLSNATTLTINGFGFDPTPANNTVAFSPAGTGTVTASTATSLTVTSLAGLTNGALNAIVTSNGQASASAQVATVVTPVPEIAVFDGILPPAGERTDNTGTVGFGSVNTGSSSAAQTFTIQNLGSATADLTGLVVTSTNATEFTFTAPLATTLAPGITTTFTVTFSPSAAGARSGVINIASNDANENPFEINVGGTGAALVRKVLLIEDQGGFGTASTILTGDGVTVTVMNNEFAAGYANLLNGAFLSQFQLVIYGERGNGNGSVLPVNVAASLEAYIQAGGHLLVTGYDTLGSPTDTVLAGLVRALSPADSSTGQAGWITANINNPILNGPFGDFRNLTFTAIPYDNDGFTPDTAAGAVALATMPTGQTRLMFTDLPGAAGSVGYWNGGVSGTTNAQPDFSTAGNPLQIFRNYVAFTAVPSGAPEIAVFDGIAPPANERTDNTGTFGFGSVNTGSSSTAQTFTIKNVGTGSLTLGTVTLTGADLGQFSVTQPLSSSLAANATTTFTATFSPSSTGLKNAVVNIASNDSNENPFEINVDGTGTTPSGGLVFTGVPIEITGTDYIAVGNEVPTREMDFTPTPGQSYPYVEVTGAANDIIGTFNDLPDGGVIAMNFNGVIHYFQVNYNGGVDGNDLIFTSLLNPGPANWKWTAGPDARNAVAIFGTEDVAAPTNNPGARQGAMNWRTPNGNLWMFGGYGYASALTNPPRYLNDLWEYDRVTGQWIWHSGAQVHNQPGNYTPADPALATPGARHTGTSWTDENGDLWLFGGFGLGASGTPGRLNDLWRFSMSSGEWDWMSGSNSTGAAGVYSGAPNTLTPGARQGATSWTSLNGTSLYLFGGTTDGGTTFHNDLWFFNTDSQNWVLVKGDATTNLNGTYGTQGTGAPANTPGARRDATGWVAKDGTLWLFGGRGLAATGATVGDMSDLWSFGNGNWTHISGPTTQGAAGTYTAPGSPGTPAARSAGSGWVTVDGDFWLVGGFKDSKNCYNDVWIYDIGTSTWTWQLGSSSLNVGGVYGTKDVAAPGNEPGARFTPSTWVTLNGAIWVFGGGGFDGEGNGGRLSDLWRYGIATPAGAPPEPSPEPFPDELIVNAAPNTSDAAAGTMAYVPVIGQLTGSDADGDKIRFLSSSPTTLSQGTLTLNPDGTWSYTPAPGFVGQSTFQFHAADAYGGSSAVRTLVITVVTNPADADNDGIADAYEQSVLGGTGADALGDADLDGQTNYFEYLAGTNPVDAAQSLSTAPSIAAGESDKGSGSFKLELNHVRPGVNYHLETSSDLDVWNRIGTFTFSVAGSATIEDPSPPTGQPQFYRVSLEASTLLP